MNEILTITEHQIIHVAKYRNIKKNTISYEDMTILLNIILNFRT